ncbi:MAG: hypothetical protein A2Z83_05795 [Omnitrophica bacterium GWA2_52_8]|nr:MAG: hypothetical protein A2Z83_05795 [Omnitrophica bacterium GWA2_52_8]
MKSLKDAKRTADRDIYLKEDRFNKPKEYFKLILQHLKKDQARAASIVDVGCATGEFLAFIAQQIPAIKKICGIDVIPDFFEVARKHLPSAQFVIEKIDNPKFRHPSRYDAATLLGVISVTFEPEIVIKNMLSLLNPGGVAYVLSNFNKDPIDVLINYRRSGVSEQWETGFNVFSMRTMEDIVKKTGARHEWVDFRMPFAIPKTDDPMRGWTEPFRDNPHTVFYGTSQHTTFKILKIFAA